MSNVNLQINEYDEVVPFDQNAEENADKCVICYENIDSKPSYQLPECNHTFHQSCINSWFRQGNAKCPLCNNIGSGLTTERYRGSIWRDWQVKFNFLRRLSRKKNAPMTLIKAMERIKKKEQSKKLIEDEYKMLRNKTISIDGKETTVKDLINDVEKKRVSLRRRRWTIIQNKRDIVLKNNIVPLIVVEKKSI